MHVIAPNFTTVLCCDNTHTQPIQACVHGLNNTQHYNAAHAIYTEVTLAHLIVLSGITYQFDGSKPWKNILPTPSSQ